MGEYVEILYFDPKNIPESWNQRGEVHQAKNNQSMNICPTEKHAPSIHRHKLLKPLSRHPSSSGSSKKSAMLDEFGYIRLKEFQALNISVAPPIVPRRCQFSVRSSPPSEVKYQSSTNLFPLRKALSLKNISQESTNTEKNRRLFKHITSGNKHETKPSQIQTKPSQIQTKQSSIQTKTRKDKPPPLPPSTRVKSIFKSKEVLYNKTSPSSSSPPVDLSRKSVFIIEWKCPNCLFVNPGENVKCCRCLSDVPEINKKYIYFSDGDYTTSGQLGIRIRVTTTEDNIGISINLQRE